MTTDHDRSIGTKSARRRAKYLARQNRELVAQLVQIRKDAGLKQADVAELLGNTQQAISEFERMLAPASLSRISNYAHAVGALVTHHVAKDCGQLESHGDRWIQFVELATVRDASFAHGVLKSFSESTVTRSVRQHGVESATGVFAGFDVAVATESRRTDFVLSA